MQLGLCTLKVPQTYYYKNVLFSVKIHFCVRIKIAILSIFCNFSISQQLSVNILSNKYYEVIDENYVGKIGEKYTAIAKLKS